MNRFRSRGTGVFRPLPTTALGLAVLLSGCAAQQEVSEIPQVVIGGLDYTFDVPDPIPSGAVELVFENRGQVPHEVFVVELVPGTTLTQMAEADSREARDAIIQRVVGILFAESGQEAAARLRLDLTPGGTYGLVCNFRDSPDAMSHRALGMLRTFQAE